MVWPTFPIKHHATKGHVVHCSSDGNVDGWRCVAFRDGLRAVVLGQFFDRELEVCRRGDQPTDDRVLLVVLVLLDPACERLALGVGQVADAIELWVGMKSIYKVGSWCFLCVPSCHYHYRTMCRSHVLWIVQVLLF